jgi:hypothetical protein
MGSEGEDSFAKIVVNWPEGCPSEGIVVLSMEIYPVVGVVDSEFCPGGFPPLEREVPDDGRRCL